MKIHLLRHRPFTLLACMLLAAAQASAQEESAENARSLLLELRQRDMERQVVGKQREIEHTNGDLRLARTQAQKLQEGMDATHALMTDTAGYLDQLVAQKSRLEQVVELTSLRMDAERQKVEGLKALGEAQFKALESVIKHIEETEARAALAGAELKALNDVPQLPEVAAGPATFSKTQPEIVDLKKKAAAYKQVLATLDKSANDAMKTAAGKLESADVAAIKAKRKAVDLGLDEKAPAKNEKAAPADR